MMHGDLNIKSKFVCLFLCLCNNYLTAVSKLICTRIENIVASPLTFMNYLITTLLSKMRCCDRKLLKSLKNHNIFFHYNFQTQKMFYVWPLFHVAVNQRLVRVVFSCWWLSVIFECNIPLKWWLYDTSDL